MKHINLLLFFISALTLCPAYGQVLQNKPHAFIIKGVVKNYTEPKWSFLQTGLFSSQGVDVPVAADGTFSKTIETANITDLYLNLNDDAIVLFALPGDTLTLTWDDKNFKNTFKVTTNGAFATRSEIALMMDIYQRYSARIIDINKCLYSADIRDSVKFNLVQMLYNDELQTIFKYPRTKNVDKILYDIYSADQQYSIG
jgi:hypothetical protein